MDPNNNQPTNPILNPSPTSAPEINSAPVASAPMENPVVNSPANNPNIQEPAPVNPVINPSANSTNQNDLANPIIQPNSDGLAATDPIMKPEPAPAPDPIAEELNSPMKANGPVPGSIGSAVSGPENVNSETPVDNPFSNNMPEKATNVSFNDPAVQPDSVQPNTGNNAPKKKTSKGTLIALIIIVAIIVIALGAVLAMQMM